MIQDIGPSVYDNSYKVTRPAVGDVILFTRGRTVSVKREGDEISLPAAEEVFPDLLDSCDVSGFNATMETHVKGDTGISGDQQEEGLTYLFRIDGRQYFRCTDTGRMPEGFDLTSIHVMRGVKPKLHLYAAVTAVQLGEWYDANRYCGRCAHPLVKDTKERMLKCPDCGNMVYPKISPAVIVAVLDGERILMSKYAGRAYKNYALLAGFNEIGESIEETVHREVMEEVGVKVKNIRFYKSQPWSFTDTLLMGFYCDLDGDDTIRLDEDELAMAQWFERTEIPVEYQDLSLTNEMIIAFKTGKV